MNGIIREDDAIGGSIKNTGLKERSYASMFPFRRKRQIERACLGYRKVIRLRDMKARFEWDPAKEASNIRKHGVYFDDAALVFADPFAILEHDRIVDGELRWQTLGMAGGFLLLLVAHTIYDDEKGTEIVRIISARRALRHERKRYEQNYRQQNDS